jgi:hypothetical protein
MIRNEAKHKISSTGSDPDLISDLQDCTSANILDIHRMVRLDPHLLRKVLCYYREKPRDRTIIRPTSDHPHIRHDPPEARAAFMV